MTLSAAGLRRLEALEVLATSGAPSVVVTLPFRVESRANKNTSNHWGERSRVSAKQRQGTCLMLTSKRAQLTKMLAAGLVVRVVRVAPARSELDGHDNLGMALKAITDGVADALKVNDRDSRVTFVPDAEVGDWGARIEFYERGDV